MPGLSNRFLQKFLIKKCEHFLGVFSVDQIPPNLWKKSCCFIVNLDESTEPGSHFVAVYIDRQNVLWYFDSYALSPLVFSTHLVSFLSPWIKSGKIKMASPFPIQNFDSLFCGWFSAAFCLFVNVPFHPNHFFSLFDERDLLKNEKIIICMLKNLCKPK